MRHAKVKGRTCKEVCRSLTTYELWRSLQTQAPLLLFVCIPILSSVGRLGVSFQRLDVPGSLNSLSVPIHERPLSPVAWIGHLSEMPTIRPSGRKQQSAKAH